MNDTKNGPLPIVLVVDLSVQRIKEPRNRIFETQTGMSSRRACDSEEVDSTAKKATMEVQVTTQPYHLSFEKSTLSH